MILTMLTENKSNCIVEEATSVYDTPFPEERRSDAL